MPSLTPPAVAPGSLAAADQPTLPIGPDALLRPWRLDDAAAVAAAYEDPEIQRWHVRRADSVAEARGWIEGWQQEWRDETGAAWAVADRDGRLLGRAALKLLNLADGNAHVAYWMLPAARGRGVCTRAVETMVAWAFDDVGLHRLELAHSVANEASCAVATRSGFVLEGVRRSAWLQADGRHDAHVHSRIRE